MDIVKVCSEGSGEIERMLALMPDISVADLAKAVSVSVMVLQQEAYTLLAEARDYDGTRRMKRAAVAGDILAKAGSLASVAGSLTRLSLSSSVRRPVKIQRGAGSQLQLVVGGSGE